MNGAHHSSPLLLGVTIQVLFRLLFASTVLLPLVVLNGETLVSAWLNIYRAVFSWTMDDFKLLNMSIDHEGADLVLRAHVTWKNMVVIGEKVIYPDPRGIANASTLLAHALQGPLVALLTVFAWPSYARKAGKMATRMGLEFIGRTLTLLPFMLILIIIDMPMVLAGELWDMVLAAFNPGEISALVLWKQFMQGGGRYALGIAVGGLAVQLAHRLSQSASRR